MSPSLPAATALRLEAHAERWPLAEPFVISRGTKTEAHVVVATLARGEHAGRGEAVPYARYGETVESVLAAILRAGPVADRTELASTLPPGAARNALDCALWDLAAKESGCAASALAGLEALGPVETCFTLSLGSPEDMAAKARSVPHLRLLKLKLGGAGDAARMAAVRAARPDARLVADANEAWTPALLAPLLAAARDCGFELVEQPLPAAADGALAGITRTVPVCADESAHTAGDLDRLAGHYDAVNIKLDKAGGLTEALVLAAAARARGLRIMAGCMVATSLAMAPAMILAQLADWVDLDGPLLLARDRSPAIEIRDGIVSPPSRLLWG
mgnify:CR=1 FL=1